MRLRKRIRTNVKRERARELRSNPTPAEEALWHALRGDEPRFSRQFVIEGFIVDFVCRAARLVVEVDGAVHDGAVEYDRERDEVLRAAGYRIVRIRNEVVLADPEAAAREIRAELDDNETGAAKTSQSNHLEHRKNKALRTPLPVAAKTHRGTNNI